MRPLRSLATTLDATESAVAWAVDQGADLVVSHHPLVWEPLTALRWDTRKGRVLRLLTERGVSLIAAHTNWDCAKGGVSDALAARLELSDVRPFGSSAVGPAWKLVAFVPVESAEAVIDAVSLAGAGRIGEYARCAFVHEGTGTFLGGPDSNPVIGRPGRIETVRESRIECIVPDGAVWAVETALVAAHPYETPAYDFVRLRDASGRPVGRIGRLTAPMSYAAFAGLVDGALSTRSVRWGQEGDVTHVAVCGGAGDDDWAAAAKAGADVFVTGEVRHHNTVEASEVVRLVQAGHYATEQPGVEALAVALEAKLGVRAKVYVPEPGVDGRPLAH